MIDKFAAFFALSCMIASLGIVAFFVPDIDLIVIISFVSMLAIYDFWQNLKSGN